MQPKNNFIKMTTMLFSAFLIAFVSGCYSTGSAQPQQVFRPPMLNSGFAQAQPGNYVAPAYQANYGYQAPQQNFANYNPPQQNNLRSFNTIQTGYQTGNNGGFNPFGFAKTSC